MDNAVYKIILVLLLLVGVYYLFSSYGWYSQAVDSPKNSNSTIFFSPESFLVNMGGGFLIIIGSLLGLNFYQFSDRIFGKSPFKTIFVVALILLGFYLATLQPVGVMTGLLQ